MSAEQSNLAPDLPATAVYSFHVFYFVAVVVDSDNDNETSKTTFSLYQITDLLYVLTKGSGD